MHEKGPGIRENEDKGGGSTILGGGTRRTAGASTPLTVALAAWMLATPAIAGSPWVRGENEGFCQLSVYRIAPYERLYRSSGPDFRTNREITDRTIEAYAEYGLTERWTLVGVAPLKLLEAGDEVQNPTLQPTIIASGTRSTLGNLTVGARRRFKDAAFALSGQLVLELPTGSVERSTGLSSGYDTVTVTPTVALGKGFSRAYVLGHLGLGLRGDDFSSDWRTGVEAGWRLFDRVWMVGLADVVRSFENGDAELGPSNLQTGLYVNDQEYVSYAGKILVNITPRFGLQITRYSATGGNNVARRALSGMGLYFEW